MRRATKMKYKISVIFSLILFATFQNNVYAQNHEDVQGWNKAKWGMTEKDIMNAFPGQITKQELEKTPDGCETLKIDNIKIVDQDFAVHFRMDCDKNILKSILILPQLKGEPTPYQNMLVFRLYDQLKLELIKKYGEPQLSESDLITKIRTKKTWVLPSTEIILEINYQEIDLIEEIDFLSLKYKQREKQDLL